MKYFFIYLLVFFSLSSMVTAQQKIVEGTILGHEKKPLANVKVSVKGREITTLSNKNGNFRIEFPEEEHTLKFSKTGMQETEIDVKNISRIEVVMHPLEKEDIYKKSISELMEIKVVPEVGPEYYLVPADGGGWIRETESDMLVPSWVIFRW